MSKINLATKLTLLRVLLVPIFIVLLEIESVWTAIAALVVFAVASITDFFDGKIARKYNIKSLPYGNEIFTDVDCDNYCCIFCVHCVRCMR